MRPALLACCFAAAAWGAAYTTIADTILTADGTALSGSVMIRWNTFQAADGTTVAGGSKRVFVSSGSLSVTLVAGGQYQVTYYSADRQVSRETWNVPQSASPIRVADIRTIVPASLSATALQGVPIDATLPVGGQILQYDQVTGRWKAASLAGLSAHASTHAAAGSDPVTLSISQITELQTALDGKASSSHDHDSVYPQFAGAYADPSWITSFNWAKLTGVPSTFAPSSHASSHRHGGADEIATATPAANAIPKAGTGGTLGSGWIPDLSATYSLASHNHSGVYAPASHTHAYTDVLSAPWPAYSSGANPPSGGCTAPAVYAETTSSPDVLYHCVSGAWAQIGSATSGTVTSVGLSMPSGFSVTGSPITTSGTLAVTTALDGVVRATGGGFTTVSGTSTDCVRVDGTSGACGGSSLPSMTGKSLYTLKVNSGETAAEWILDTPGAGMSKTRVSSSDVWAVDSTQVPYLALNNAFLGDNSFGGLVNMSGASAVRLKTGTSAPATCTVGDTFFDTDATAGQNLYGCTATNTWTLLGDGGGGGGSTTSYISLPAATCQMGAAGTGFALPSSLYPTPGCSVGSNTLLGYLEWPDADGDYSVQTRIDLQGTISSINLGGKWRTSATSGDVVWQISTACAADAETGDPAWNSAQTITDTAKATTLQLNDFSLTGLTLTGCASGETLFLRLVRNRTHASDTLAATAQLVSLTLTINR